MSAKAFVVAPEDYPRPLNVVGEHITVQASGAMTGGYEIFLQEGPVGTGPPPHSHPWDESFFVTPGEVDFNIDGPACILIPETHRQRNEENPDAAAKAIPSVITSIRGCRCLLTRLSRGEAGRLAYAPHLLPHGRWFAPGVF